MSVALVLISGIVCFYIYYIFNNLLFLNGMIHRNYDVVEQPIQLTALSKRLVQESREFIDNATAANAPYLLVVSFVHIHTVLRVSKDWEGSSRHGILGDAIHEMDWSVGEILAAVEESGARDNTLVAFTSDHGAHIELGSHGGYNGVFRGITLCLISLKYVCC